MSSMPTDRHGEVPGRVVRIAVVDSGVHVSHPHVGRVAGGVAINADGTTSDDYVDRIGHGTAVMAAIREKAPAADCYAVRIFDGRLSTTASTLVAAIDWAIGARVDIVNLSLGTAYVVGIPGLPYPLWVWAPPLLLGPVAFAYALFGIGIPNFNRFTLIGIALGWAAFYPVLSTWNLLA